MSQPDRSFFLSAGVAQAVERVLAVAFGNNYVGSRPTINIFLNVAQAAERVLAPVFGNKLCWFESHCRHISLCAYLKSNWLQMMVDMETKMCVE